MNSTIDVDPQTLTIVGSVVIPFLIALITKSKAADKLKASFNIVLTGAWAFLANSVTDTGHAVFSLTSLRDWAVGIVVSIGTYYGVLKPMGGNEALLPGKGFGKEQNDD